MTFFKLLIGAIFHLGHLSHDANQDFVCKEKQNNMGIYIGNVANYNDKKGHITLNLNESIAIRRFYHF